MELIDRHATAHERKASARRLTTVLIALAVLAVVAAALFAMAGAFKGTPLPAANLSAQQVVIRGEVADRLAQSAMSGLSAQQIVIRGEVADRLARVTELSPEQIVIRGEVKDRLLAPAN